MLFNHCPYFQNVFIIPNRNSVSINPQLPILPSSQALVTSNLFCVSMNWPILYISYEWDHTIFSCVWLISLSMTFPSFLRVEACIIISFLLRLNNILLYVHITFKNRFLCYRHTITSRLFIFGSWLASCLPPPSPPSLNLPPPQTPQLGSRKEGRKYRCSY